MSGFGETWQLVWCHRDPDHLMLDPRTGLHVRGSSHARTGEAEAAGAGLHVAVVDYNWNRHGRIVDVGGAYGSFLASILAKHPKPRGQEAVRLMSCGS